MTHLETLQETLPTLTKLVWKREEGDFERVEVAPRSFIRDGFIYLSMEEGDGAGSYDGHYTSEGEQDGIPYINDRLEAWAKSNGGYWEWQDGGTIVFSN